MSSFLESVPISLWLLLTLTICLTNVMAYPCLEEAPAEKFAPDYDYDDCYPYRYPTPKPIVKLTRMPTPRPTPKPTSKPSTVPTKAPTNYPTKRPTHYPTKKPVAPPTSSPSPQPTTASPTQPGFISCGEDSVGMYSSGKLIFEISMPFDGELIFDASGSKVALTTIEAFTKLGSLLATDSDHDEVITLPTAVIGDYTFIMASQNSGIYHVRIRCAEIATTMKPTPKPSTSPTQRPTTTAAPTSSPSPRPTTSYPTQKPTSKPTSRPTLKPTPKPSTSPTQRPTTTAAPTSSPSPRPTTSSPTQKPSKTPTTRSPTAPGTLTCGDVDVGPYNGEPLNFNVAMPFDGQLIFDATSSQIEVTDIEAFTKLGSLLSIDSDHDGIITLPTSVAGNYKFIVAGQNTGQYHVNVRCLSDKPTPLPTQPPTKVPTIHPITVHTSPSPILAIIMEPVTSSTKAETKPSIETTDIDIGFSIQNHDKNVEHSQIMWLADYMTHHMSFVIIAVLCLCVLCLLIVICLLNTKRRKRKKVDQNSPRTDETGERSKENSGEHVHLQSMEVIISMDRNTLKTYSMPTSPYTDIDVDDIALPGLPAMDNNTLYDTVRRHVLDDDGDDDSSISSSSLYDINANNTARNEQRGEVSETAFID
eukprot:1083101_1